MLCVINTRIHSVETVDFVNHAPSTHWFSELVLLFCHLVFIRSVRLFSCSFVPSFCFFIVLIRLFFVKFPYWIRYTNDMTSNISFVYNIHMSNMSSIACLCPHIVCCFFCMLDAFTMEMSEICRINPIKWEKKNSRMSFVVMDFLWNRFSLSQRSNIRVMKFHQNSIYSCRYRKNNFFLKKDKSFSTITEILELDAVYAAVFTNFEISSAAQNVLCDA